MERDEEEVDRPAAGFELTDEQKDTLEMKYDQFEALVEKSPLEAQQFIVKYVGVERLDAATSYIIGLRMAKVRAAAAKKGLRVGI